MQCSHSWCTEESAQKNDISIKLKQVPAIKVIYLQGSSCSRWLYKLTKERMRKTKGEERAGKIWIGLMGESFPLLHFFTALNLIKRNNINKLIHYFSTKSHLRYNNILHTTCPMMGLEHDEQCPFGTVETPCCVMLRSRSSISVFRLALFDGRLGDTGGTLCVGNEPSVSDWAAGITKARPDCGNGRCSEDTNRSTGPGRVTSTVIVDNLSSFDSCKW